MRTCRQELLKPIQLTRTKWEFVELVRDRWKFCKPIKLIKIGQGVVELTVNKQESNKIDMGRQELIKLVMNMRGPKKLIKVGKSLLHSAMDE